MRLTAKVTEVISGSESRDGQQRVKLKVAEGDSMFKSLIVVNGAALALDDELVVLVLTKEQAAGIAEAVDELDNLPPQPLRDLADQLRPDAPLPWEQADAEEFERTSYLEPQPNIADTRSH